MLGTFKLTLLKCRIKFGCKFHRRWQRLPVLLTFPHMQNSRLGITQRDIQHTDWKVLVRRL